MRNNRACRPDLASSLILGETSPKPPTYVLVETRVAWYALFVASDEQR